MKIQDYAIAQENWARKKSTRETGKETGRDNTLQVDKDENPANISASDSAKDAVEISSESIQKSKEELEAKAQETADTLKNLKEQLEIARKQAEGAAEEWRIRILCLKIAMRIVSGDIVPRKDHQYLAEHDPELYGKAISMRVEKEEPKKLKRLSKDEKEEEGEEDSDSDTAIDGSPGKDRASASDSESNIEPGDSADASLESASLGLDIL